MTDPITLPVDPSAPWVGSSAPPDGLPVAVP